MDMNRSGVHLRQDERIGWVDLLRVLSCFLVVFAHCCDPFVAQFDQDRASFLTGAFSGSLVRSSVPLFVMMTGVLLLPVQRGMADFYRKRIGRIIVPLIFWSIALPILFFVYLNYIQPHSANAALPADGFTPQATGVKLYTFIFNFNFDTTPLWYLYMLVGLYLILPILSAWLERATKREIRLFLWVWGATLLLPYLRMIAPMLGYAGNYGHMGLFGECDWNLYGTFYYVSGFIGYLVLAHYLVLYPPAWSWRKTLCIVVPMFVMGYLITALGYVWFQKQYPGNYAYLEIVWYFTGINVFVMTYAVFVVIRKLNLKPSRWLANLASLTFGIYLCHFIFVHVAYDCFAEFGSMPYFLRIVCMACSAFVVSGVIVWVMKRWKVTRRLVV